MVAREVNAAGNYQLILSGCISVNFKLEMLRFVQMLSLLLLLKDIQQIRTEVCWFC